MIRKEIKQGLFLGVDYLCDRLVPKDDFYRTFKEKVAPLIKDEHFEDMYCPDNGRPAVPPSLLAQAIILQMHRNRKTRKKRKGHDERND